MNSVENLQNGNEDQSEDLKMKAEIWEKKRGRINEKRRLRRQRQKEENPEYRVEEWRKQRQKQREENPEYRAEESAKRQERRQREDPEKQKAKLERLKQQRQNERTKMFNDLFDSYFEKNKHTFPTPVSQNLWEKLKKDEIDFEKRMFGNTSTIKELYDYRQDQINLLRQNPDHPCAGSIIFYIKTFVHRPKDQRKLADEEKDYVDSLVLSPFKKDETKTYDYYETKKEYYKEKKKENYEKKKFDQKSYNLNVRFMKADPNKVLSLDDITRNPFVSNFSQKEEYKINLWKQDKNPEYLEKWKREREDYEKEVEDLSIEYKENFLKQMK